MGAGMKNPWNKREWVEVSVMLICPLCLIVLYFLL